MSIKIEKLTPEQIPSKGRKSSGKTREFVLLLKKLSVGESFLWPVLDSNLRNSIRIASVLLEAKFLTAAECDGMRVVRIA